MPFPVLLLSSTPAGVVVILRARKQPRAVVDDVFHCTQPAVRSETPLSGGGKGYEESQTRVRSCVELCAGKICMDVQISDTCTDG